MTEYFSFSFYKTNELSQKFVSNPYKIKIDLQYDYVVIKNKILRWLLSFLNPF